MRSNIKSVSRKSLLILPLATLAFFTFINTITLHSAQASKELFSYFVNKKNNSGYWAGKGTIIASSGETETLKCRATYFLSSNGSELQQNLRCASPSYSIRARSRYTTNGRSITGNWIEETFNIRGSVSGKSQGNKLDLSVAGQHVNASMSIVVKKCSQLIKILPIDAPIKIIAMNFGRC